jgi:hypothetical protein
MMKSSPTKQWYTLLDQYVYLLVAHGNPGDENGIREFLGLDAEIIPILETSPHALVHIITDLRDTNGTPPLREIRKIKYGSHPHMGYSVTIGALRNPTMRVMLKLANAVFRTRYYDAVSLDEACAFLITKDANLPPLSAWTLPETTASASAL